MMSNPPKITSRDWQVLDLTIALQKHGIMITFDITRQVLAEMDDTAKQRRYQELVAINTA